MRRAPRRARVVGPRLIAGTRARPALAPRSYEAWLRDLLLIAPTTDAELTSAMVGAGRDALPATRARRPDSRATPRAPARPRRGALSGDAAPAIQVDTVAQEVRAAAHVPRAATPRRRAACAAGRAHAHGQGRPVAVRRPRHHRARARWCNGRSVNRALLCRADPLAEGAWLCLCSPALLPRPAYANFPPPPPSPPLPSPPLPSPLPQVLTSPTPTVDGKVQPFSCQWDCYYCPNQPGQPRSYAQRACPRPAPDPPTARTPRGRRAAMLRRPVLPESAARCPSSGALVR